MKDEAEAKAKYSVNGKSVKKQLEKNAQAEDKTEATAQMDLSAAKQKINSVKQGVAVLEEGQELPHLKAQYQAANNKMNVADVMARNAEDDYDAANHHLEVAVSEQKRKDERAKVATEIRHKKAITAHRIAELEHFKADHLKKEAKSKLEEAQLARDARNEAVIEEAKEQDEATKKGAKEEVQKAKEKES